MEKINKLLLGLFLIAGVVLFTGCGDDDDDDDNNDDIAMGDDDDAPPEENEVEVITDVTLTFTPDGGGTAITATAQDMDGDGPEDLEVTQEIELSANTSYTLTIDLLNALDPDDVESITEEIEEEADEHQFFFAFTDGLFTTPGGDGNIDDRDDEIEYVDFDSNELPVGLETTWATGAAGTGTFRVRLQHQPPAPDGTPVKTETSDFMSGDTDIDITWEVTIQ